MDTVRKALGKVSGENKSSSSSSSSPLDLNGQSVQLSSASAPTHSSVVLTTRAPRHAPRSLLLFFSLTLLLIPFSHFFFRSFNSLKWTTWCQLIIRFCLASMVHSWLIGTLNMLHVLFLLPLTDYLPKKEAKKGKKCLG